MSGKDEARKRIDALLLEAGWLVQDDLDIGASQGVAVREFQTKAGSADYLLVLNGKVAEIIENLE